MENDTEKANRSITLKDIANATGYTINTVSRALNDKEDISEATKGLIRKKADELGYIKNSAAGSLRSKKTKTIAVIVGDISNPFFSIIVKEIETFARRRDYNTFIINTEEDATLEELAVRSALEKKVDGIILCPSQKKSSAVLLLKKLGFPFVLLGRYFEDIKCDYVIADDKKGGYIATKHLIEKGHKDILFVNGPKYISSAYLRLQGYIAALKEYDIPYNPELVKEVSVTGDFSYFTEQISQSIIDFTAVLAFSDMLAWEILHTVNRLENKKILFDIIGFDNIQSHLLVPLPLTTINYDKQKLAQLSFEVLLSRIDGNNSEDPVHVVLDTELIIR